VRMAVSRPSLLPLAREVLPLLRMLHRQLLRRTSTTSTTIFRFRQAVLLIEATHEAAIERLPLPMNLA
jgi:hypothetical protein